VNKRSAPPAASTPILESGEEAFTIESRIIREFGERLVKHPEVALLELIKNGYDADARTCTVDHDYPDHLTVTDTGHGMTLEEFQNGWMRIGTSSKESKSTSRAFNRSISGEKGIGRFAVRYLGRHLVLETTAFDKKRKRKTTLQANFNWPQFDRNEDLGTVKVPYQLVEAKADTPLGTVLRVTQLRASTEKIDFRQVLTASLGLLSPYQALLRKLDDDDQEDLPAAPSNNATTEDPGFNLVINSAGFEDKASVANAILKNFVFRCVVSVEGGRLALRLYRRGEKKPWLRVNDRFENLVGRVYADIRFFPARKGTFSGMPVDGREARTWVKNHAGVAVFDRDFRVLPYGTAGDDWLALSADTARNQRNPQSSVAQRHFPMDEATRKSTQLNYMLRLPYPSQLVGAVQVFGVRSKDQDGDEGLLATADRQGFVENEAYKQLVDIVRGAAEVMAYADRELQLEEEERETAEAAKTAHEETQEAIAQIRLNANLTTSEKASLVKRLALAQEASERHGNLARSRDAALEVMSLLGVVAGFMTHEFGTAINQLERSHAILAKLAKNNAALAKEATAIHAHIAVLKDFVAYSQGYVKGTSIVPDKALPAKPRIKQVLRVFGKYASDRQIEISEDVGADVRIPRVPISLYSGIVLNLYTNALKAVTARAGAEHQEIAVRAWNEKGFHRLQVSDTGVGIPSALQERIFDPLFTTTDSNRDPLGSGMGLGLTLVRRGAKAFGGSVQLVKPPPGFSTCFEVKFPMTEDE
jgi:signal transduction histidine kinase